jgi:glycosyltransferase involved in cell wall biosynthesis
MKISYIHGICVKNDAISNSIRDEIEWLIENAKHQVKLFSYVCDHKNLPFKNVTNLSDVAFDSHFQASDLVIFHFGIFYPLFDLIFATPKNAKRLVIFHNITPIEFASRENRETVKRSFDQMANIMFADHVACVSETNLNVLRSAGIDRPVTISPLAIHSKIIIPQAKPSFVDEIVRIVFIGRFVKAKGPGELLDAIYQIAKDGASGTIKLDMVGNLNFSDLKVIEDVKKKIESITRAYHGRIEIEIHDNATDDKKHQLLCEADLFTIPTYHEGFCVPFIEALASGCKVIAYNNSNIPSISGGFGKLVPTGNVCSLAEAILLDLIEIRSKTWRTDAINGFQAYAKSVGEYIKTYSINSTKSRFLNLIKKLS